MSKTYFGFALADSMFEGECVITREPADAGTVEAAMHSAAMGVGEFISCCNPSHEATIAAMRSRFGLEVPIPATPPRVTLGVGDAVIVMGVRGLPRLTDRHEYTEEEVAAASFQFSIYTVRD